MSSSEQNPVYQSDVTQTICGRSSDANDGGYYEFQWHTAWNKLLQNQNGTTGWATIIHSTNPACKPKTICRIHLCAYTPCESIWPASKYGQVGPPIHLQEAPKQSELPAVAEPSGSQLPLPAAAQTAVAGSSSETPSPAAEPAPVGPAPVVEPAPVEEPATALKQAVGLEPGVNTDMAEVPDCPKEAALNNMKPPAPVSHTHVDPQGVANATAVAVTAVAGSPTVAAQHTIQATLLALAREIRRPRAYVGYSAFILMGLLKKCRPCVWEGANFIDLLEVFAPWAKEHCTMLLPATAIPCTLMAKATSCVELIPISAEYPLSQTKHFVAGIRMPECEVFETSCNFETLYASLGVAIMTSILNGDCGLDVMTIMLGIAPSASARSGLRIELSDYLIERIGEPWIHDIMVACQELRQEDVDLYRSCDAKILAPPTAPAPAVADPPLAAP